MNIHVTCKACGEKFDFDYKVLTSKITINKTRLKMTYYKCPLCNHIYSIMIDDYKSLLALNRYQSQVKLIELQKRTGKTKKNTIEKMFKLKQELKHMRDELSERYNYSIYQLDECNYKLELPKIGPDQNLERRNDNEQF